MRGRQRRAVARAGGHGHRTGGRTDGGALHLLTRAARAAGRRRGRGRGIRHRRTIGRVSLATPAVTVIVPGFDVEDYAVDALDSLRAQTRGDWVALLIDDASADGTGAIFDEAAAGDARFRVVHQESRQGLGAARNVGLDLVQTPFVAFLDADDRLTPQALE